MRIDTISAQFNSYPPMEAHGLSLIFILLVHILTDLFSIVPVTESVILDSRCDDIWEFPVCPLTVPQLCTDRGLSYGYRCLVCIFGWLNQSDTTLLLDRAC